MSQNLYTLRRLGNYIFEINFNKLPEYSEDGDSAPLFSCSSYVQNGKLYRNLDWDYDELASFRVVCPDFTGMSFIAGLTDAEQPEEKLLQLPYRMVDGVNKHGIMCAAHVLFNDWDFHGDGNLPLTQLPFLVLTKVRSMATIEADLTDVLSNLYAPDAMAALEYLIQVIVTDGDTTYVLRPSTSGTGNYEAVDITENPKLTNFLWVAAETVTRQELQLRPTGVERWNMMPCPLAELQFTKAYEHPTRLSEFIGLRDTTKYSTDAQLEAIYEDAHAIFLTRERDGQTWQTMHSAVYAQDGMKHLWVQENLVKDYCAKESKIQKSIKNGLLTGGVISAYTGNSPAEYDDRERRYFEPQTVKFARQKAKYSGDYFIGRVEGLYGDAPKKWTEVKMRLADVIKPSASLTSNFDDFKSVLIAEPPIDYLRIGTKIECMGNVWIAVNPANISSPLGNGVIRRCNAVFNYYDYYGNVKSEPIIVEKILANASDSDAQKSGLITKGSFNVICQYNDVTRQLNTNSRLILGSGAYRITGYSDFATEFTGDYSSRRLLEFTIRYEEPNEAIDDMQNRIASGKEFSWDISATSPAVISVGEEKALAVTSKRNGVEVESTAEYPIEYIFTSSDENIAVVNAQGVVRGITEGEAVITVTLKQNPLKTQNIALHVESVSAEPKVEFLTTVPDEIDAYTEVEIKAAYFENGQQTGNAVSWILSGAGSGAYSYEIHGNTVIIHCWSGSVEPLIITAKYGDYQKTAEIFLRGM